MGQSSLDKKQVLLEPGPQSCCPWESEYSRPRAVSSFTGSKHFPVSSLNTHSH